MQLAVLDSDADFGDCVTRLMEELGHTVRRYRDAKSMLSALRRNSFDLLLLNWTLSDSSGHEVLRWTRDHMDPAPPAIIVTPRTDEADIIAGLAQGADDYLTKPVHDDVLKARVSALLRRIYGCPLKRDVESFKAYAFNLRSQSVTNAGVSIATTRKEFALALLLFRNLHRPLSRGHLMDAVWGLPAAAASRTLDAHISQIRARLGLRPENGLRLSSVYGFGYRLEEIDAIAA